MFNVNLFRKSYKFIEFEEKINQDKLYISFLNLEFFLKFISQTRVVKWIIYYYNLDRKMIFKLFYLFVQWIKYTYIYIAIIIYFFVF